MEFYCTFGSAARSMEVGAVAVDDDDDDAAANDADGSVIHYHPNKHHLLSFH